MFKLLIAVTCIAAVSAYGDCPSCASAAAASGCNSCTVAANSFRILDCSLNACGDRRLAETTDLEEAAPATAQWGRRRRRFFDARRRRRRTNYPTPFPTPYPTPSPTGVLGHHTCKYTTCRYTGGQTEIFTFQGAGVGKAFKEDFHCEKFGSGCRCACHNTLKCALRHHHTSGYKKTFEHC